MTAHAKGLSIAYSAFIMMSIGITVVQVIPMNAVTMVFYRCAIAAPFLWLVLRARGDSLFIEPQDRMAAFWIGFLTGAHWIALFASITLGTVAVAMISLYCYPIFSTLIEAFVQKRNPRTVDLAICAITLVGVALLTPVMGAPEHLLPSVAFGIISAVFWSGRIVLVHHRMRRYNSASLMLWSLLIISILLLPSAFIPVEPGAWSGATVMKLLFLGIFVTGLCHTLLLVALRYISATLLGQVGPVQIAASALAAWAFLDEPLTLRMIIGGAVVCLAGAWATRTHRKINAPD